MFHVEHNEGGGNLRVELCTMFHVERSMIEIELRERSTHPRSHLVNLESFWAPLVLCSTWNVFRFRTSIFV